MHAGDIIDLVYVIIEGTVVTRDSDLEIDQLGPASVFGATKAARRRYREERNEIMPFTVQVASDTCKMAVFHLQHSFWPDREKSPSGNLQGETPTLSDSWRRLGPGFASTA